MSAKQFFSRVRRLRRRTWIISGSAVVALGVAAVVVFGFVLPAQSAQAQTRTITATASLETLEQSVSGTGTLSPLVDEDVSWDGSGTVLNVYVEEGQTVKKGDKLGRIDTLQLKADLLDAKVTLADAQARLADSSSTAAELAANTASVAVAKKAVADAQDAYDSAVLVAPVDGVVTSVGVEVGDSVGSSSSQPSASGDTSTAAFHITGTDTWQVSVSLGETDIALIAKDDQVELSTDDGTSFFGTVKSIGLLPDTSSGASAYPVVVAVTGTADGLFDGVSVTAKIVYERRTDVLTVPSAAVTTGSDGTSTVTVVATDGTQTVTDVTVGETADNLTEITQGISEGDTVLVASFTPGSGNQGTQGNGGNFTGGTFPGGVPPDGTFPGGTGGAPTTTQGGNG